jgi:hypothetical protein
MGAPGKEGFGASFNIFAALRFIALDFVKNRMVYALLIWTSGILAIPTGYVRHFAMIE